MACNSDINFNWFFGLSLFFLGLFEVSSLRTLSGSEIIYLLVLGTVGVPVQFGLFP